MLFNDIKTEKDLDQLKRKIAQDKALWGRILGIRKKGIFSAHQKGKNSGAFPTNTEILFLYNEMVKAGEITPSPQAELLLRRRKIRSNSGIVSVAVLTKPFPCPGQCLYCPTEKNMPKSYLSKEPAASRALANNFDPYKQTMGRLDALKANGHPVDKVEIIVIGGTWSFYPKKYQESFISELFRACNNFSLRDGKGKKIIRRGEMTLFELQKINEKAGARIIGLSIETRPDFIDLSEIKKLRELGVTKVEIGVQHLDDKVLAMNKREVDTGKTAEATAILRANGFKIVYHMMLNLYGSSPAKDIAMFEKLFSDERFCPDMLKIYPCVLLKPTPLYKVWKQGKYKLYSDKILAKILSAIKKKIPPYVRIIRVVRDIPAGYIIAGSKVSNMRQWIEEDQKKNRWHCRCIRCREVREDEIDLKNLKMRKLPYMVSGGKEMFLSWEDKKKDKIAAFLRLFLPHFTKTLQGESALPVLKDCAIIRELHTYGRLTPVDEKEEQGSLSLKASVEHCQHRGLGRLLMEEAEKIARVAGYKKIAVISGVGVRGYYKKIGYRLKDNYMVKSM